MVWALKLRVFVSLITQKRRFLAFSEHMKDLYWWLDWALKPFDNKAFKLDAWDSLWDLHLDRGLPYDLSRTGVLTGPKSQLRYFRAYRLQLGLSLRFSWRFGHWSHSSCRRWATVESNSRSRSGLLWISSIALSNRVRRGDSSVKVVMM